MGKNNFLDKSLKTITGISDNITSKYDNHIKQKAIEIVDNEITSLNLEIEDIEQDDYEAMVSEQMIKLKEKYASNTAKVGLSLLGLDLLFGV